MKVELHNVGDGVRVIHDSTGKQLSIKINEKTVADIPPRLEKRLREAAAKGGTLLVASAAPETKPGRVRIEREVAPAKTIETKPAPKPKAETKPAPKPKPEPKPAAKAKDDGKGKTDVEQLTAVEVLAIADSLDYHSLLAAVNRAVPDNQLPPRPTKPQMIDVLREAAPKVA